jgi:FMN phosphatase YigB (HAD superfamily)
LEHETAFADRFRGLVRRVPSGRSRSAGHGGAIMIDAVISDLGNVLLRFDNTVFFNKLTAYTSRSVEEIRRVTHDNLDLLTLFERGRVSPLDFFTNARDLLEITAGYEEFYAAYNDVFVLDPAVLGILRGVKPVAKMALLSNTDIMRWTFIKSRFPEILFFDAYSLSFDVGAMKPDPAIYRDALDALGSSPERSLFIDDLQENVEAAERLGIRGLHFTPQTDLRAELAQLGIKF